VPSSHPVEPLWNARQVAHRLGIHRTHLYQLVRTGRIPHLRVGRAVRFDPKVIATWVYAGGWASPSVQGKSNPQMARS
jgi:excisionase family DNA binding protein